MYEEIIRDIRKCCRMAMNGIASTSMRSQGLDYKLNFGVPVGEIKQLANRYESDAELAELLWADGTRELKILATHLYPSHLFSKKLAKKWIIEIPNQEIREQLTINLLQYLSYVEDLGQDLANSDDARIRTSAYWFLSRYLLVNKDRNQLCLENLPFVWKDAVVPEVSLRNAALLFLKHLGRTSKEISDTILREVSVYKDSNNPFQKEAFDSLHFEFEFFFDEE